MKVVKFIRTVFDSIAKLNDNTKKWVIGILAVTAAIGPLLIFAGMLAGSFAALLHVMALFMSPAGMIIGLLGALGTALVTSQIDFNDLSGSIKKMSKTGIKYLKMFAESVKVWSIKTVNFIGRVGKTWINLKDSSKKQFMIIGASMLGLLTVWRMHVVAGIINSTRKIGKTLLKLRPVIGLVSKGFFALAMFLAGLKLYKVLEDSFDFTGFLLSSNSFLSALTKGWNSFFSNLGASATLFAQEIWKILTFQSDQDFSKVWKPMTQSFNAEMNVIKKRTHESVI